MDASNTLIELLGGVRSLHADLVDRELELKDELATVITEKRRLEAVIKAAQGPQPKQEEEKPKEKPKHYISDEMVEQVKSAIMGIDHSAMPDVPGSFTKTQIVETEVASQFSVHNAINVLRERGEVRLVGTLDSPGQPKVWALVGSNGDGS